MKKPVKKKQLGGLPSREDVLAFIGTHKGKAGVREIARAFGLKNADRAALRQMVRGLTDEGAVEGRRKKLHHAGTLPSVVLADITHRDADGELIAVPTEWDVEAHGEAPRIRIHVPRKARPAEIPGVGDRVLTRTEETGEEGEAIRHSGRVIKVLDNARDLPERKLIESVYGVDMSDCKVIVTEFKLPIDERTYKGDEKAMLPMRPDLAA